MTEQFYRERLQALRLEHRSAIKELQKLYALSNNPHKEGDIISDHMHTICIDKIYVNCTESDRLPQCVYEGVTYTKKGQPNKRLTRETIYQSNVHKNGS